jgi:hypothetical protein
MSRWCSNRSVAVGRQVTCVIVGGGVLQQSWERHRRRSNAKEFVVDRPGTLECTGQRGRVKAAVKHCGKIVSPRHKGGGRRPGAGPPAVPFRFKRLPSRRSQPGHNCDRGVTFGFVQLLQHRFDRETAQRGQVVAEPARRPGSDDLEGSHEPRPAPRASTWVPVASQPRSGRASRSFRPDRPPSERRRAEHSGASVLADFAPS